MTNKLLLLVLSLLLITAFFLLPDNRRWLQERIFPYYRQLPRQVAHLDPEYRKAYRFESSYTLSRWVADSIRSLSGGDSVLLLVPSTSYFEKHGVSYHVPEPAVFYYFTGMRTVWHNSPDAIKANWYLRVLHKKVQIERVTDKVAFKDSLAQFQKYGVTL